MSWAVFKRSEAHYAVATCCKQTYIYKNYDAFALPMRNKAKKVSRLAYFFVALIGLVCLPFFAFGIVE